MNSCSTSEPLRRFQSTALSVLASLALAGGPAISAAHAKSVERRSRADANAKRRAHHLPKSANDRSPAKGRSDAGSEKPPVGASWFSAPSAAKPAETDSSDLNSCLSIALEDLPRAEIFQSADPPDPWLPISSLHHPSYRAQAPPATSN